MTVPSNLIPTRITQLPTAPSADPNGLLVYVLNGVTYKIAAGDLLQVSGVPTSRNVFAGTGLTGGGQLSADVTLGVAIGGIGQTQLDATGVTAGTFGTIMAVPQIQIDATGRITSAVNLPISYPGLGSVSSVDVDGGTTGLTFSGGPITTTGTITMAGALAIANGGTSATSAAAALTALGAYPASNPSSFGSGTVTTASVVGANGFAGTVTTATTTPAITITTTVTGLLKGNATAISAATAGTDYLAPPSGTSILKANSGGALANAVENTDYVPAVMTAAGDVMYGGALGVATRLGIGGANTVLHGGASSPSYSAVVEDDISLSANTTNDVTTGRHGFCPVLPNNATLFLNGQGNYTLPSGLTISASYSATAFSGQTSVNVIHNFGAYPVVQVVDNTGAVLIPLTTVNNTLNDLTVTFASSTTGTIMATVGSPQPQALTVASGNYTVLTTDRIVKVTASAVTITLPTSVGNTGREFIINNTSTGNITVATTSSQTITASLTQLLPSYSSMTVYSDGANWWII